MKYGDGVGKNNHDKYLGFNRSKFFLAVMFAFSPAMTNVALAGPGFLCDKPAIPETATCVGATTTPANGIPGSWSCATGDILNVVAGTLGETTTKQSGVACPTGYNLIPTYYANSPQIRKFVDTLPGLTSAGKNTFANGATGEYIPLAVADSTSYPGSNYYVIGVVQHEQRMHSDLQKATLQRSYVQLYPDSATAPTGGVALKYPDIKDINGNVITSGANITWPSGRQVYGYDNPHYLGPIIVTAKGTAVRIKMMNFLPTGAAGEHFLPVDQGLPGAENKYPQNRVAIHLHGGDSPWISDGTPHQWFGAVGDANLNKKGDRLTNVPDMPDPGDGAQTIYWPNDQSARLMWYHDHTFGLTRQNAYAGEAAGYIIIDEAELALLGKPDPNNPGQFLTTPITVNGTPISKSLPGTLLEQIPLIIQDKTFVPTDITTQDAKWDLTKWGKPGDMWFPHVYEPNVLNDGKTLVNNPAGRWDFGPTDNLWGGQVSFLDISGQGEYGYSSPYLKGTSADASTTPEAYNDTPVINGVAYPTMTVEPKAYRVRFLNGANDRYWNLSLWVADSTVISADGRTNTEVKMIPAADGRAGGIPDPAMAGPSIIQFGNEAGLLPAPVIHSAQPINLNAFGEVVSGGFYLGGAERGDTVIDFSKYAGKTLILYNDTPAPIPSGDSRYDYYTGNPDQTLIGGAPTTPVGMGPNTRTIMQIKVAANIPVSNFSLATLQTELPKAYAASADAEIALNATVDVSTGAVLVNYQDPADINVPKAIKTATPQLKVINGDYDPNFGRLIANFATDIKTSPGGAATPLAYIDEATEIVEEGKIQFWRIRNTDADNHPIHFHLFNVKVLGRIDNSQATVSQRLVMPPLENEKGWKETVQMWPGQDTIVAIKAKTPALPFGLPDSVRLMDPTLPQGTQFNDSLDYTKASNPSSFKPMAFQQIDLITGAYKPVSNEYRNFGWEYTFHCHILGHEENDLMRPMIYYPNIAQPGAPTIASLDATGKLTWTDATPVNGLTTKGNPANEIGFRVERADVSSTNVPPTSWVKLGPTNNALITMPGVNTFGGVNTLANATSFQDNIANPTVDYAYRVVAVNQAVAGMSTGETSSAVAFLPQAPAGLTGSFNSLATATVPAKSVTLNWQDKSAVESGYVVQRATGKISGTTGLVTWGLPASLPTATSVLAPNLTTYLDSGANVVANTLYQYQVKAVSGVVSSPISKVSVATATTLAAVNQFQLSGPATASTLGIQWQQTTSALATGYEVQTCKGICTSTSPSSSWKPIPPAVIMGLNNTKYMATGLDPKTSYTFRVRAINSEIPTLVSPDRYFSAKTL